MWFLGAVLGAVLGGSIDSALAIFGALFGGLLGWVLGSRARQRQEDRLKTLEQRLSRVEAALKRLERPEGRALGSATPARPAPEGDDLDVPGAPASVAVGTPVLAGSASAILPVTEPRGATAEAEVPPMELPRLEPAPPAELDETPEATPGPAWEWLLRGNLMARVGVIILFIGMGFLLKYAYQHIEVPIELRLIGVALGAVALLGIGWRLRRTREGYGLALQGGGVGLLYLTIFAALRLFELIPTGPAFALLLAVVVLSAALAVLQDSLALAVLGASGGFLAPILVSTGTGSHVALFSYYAALNVGILALAWFRAWRVLNLVGFAFTFGIATLWGVLRYRPEQFVSTEPFLILFFAMYVAIPVMFSRHAAGPIARHLDATLVFGVPLLAFGLQVGMVREFVYGSAWSAVAVGAFYLLLARTLWSRRGEGMRLLVEAFLALGVVFATLAIPLAFDGRWTSAVWALEGAAMLWVGVRQQRLLARLFGLLLQVLAGAFFLADLGAPSGEWPVLNRLYLGTFLLAAAGLFSAWLLQRSREVLHPAERGLESAVFLWGVLWWTVGGLQEIQAQVRYVLQGNAALGFFTGSCLAFGWLERRLVWSLARYPALALLPLMAGLGLISALRDAHPLAHFGYIAWPLAFSAHLFLLHRCEAAERSYLKWLHAGGLWLLAALGAWEVAWSLDQWAGGRAAWPLIGWALVPGALLLLLGMRIDWPVAVHLDAYLVAGAMPLAAFLGVWFVVGTALSNGDSWPLPYLPILNPLDLAQAGALLAVANWFVEVRRLGLPPLAGVSLPAAAGLAAVAGFLWTSAVLLRTLHHWAGVPFSLAGMLRSDLVQASLSLLWTLLALGAMVLATRRSWRRLWLVGAGLMAVVVMKLFVVELSNVGTIERIVSFLGVGVLMLVIGFLAPVPPKQGEGM